MFPKTSKKLTRGSCAAYAVSKYYTYTTKAGDWWLPSKDELELIYKNQKDAVFNTCGIVFWHWSSSEIDNEYIWGWYFANEEVMSRHKWRQGEAAVRAVRAF